MTVHLHTRQSGAHLLGFFSWLAKKKLMINASRFSPELSWAGQLQIFYFRFYFYFAKPPLCYTCLNYSFCFMMYYVIVCM